MCGGQAVDLLAAHSDLTLSMLTTMHRMKTGAMIRASALMGLYAGQTMPEPALIGAIANYSACVGLAFQVIDDILDVTAETEVLGKTAGKDAANEKRRNTLSKKAQENLPLLQQITDEILTEEPKTATDVAAVLEVSVQKASGLLRRLVEDGKAVKVDVKIKGKGTQKGYTLPMGVESFDATLDGAITPVTE